ncbi:STAS domain-containing protein [Dactylosporangium sp. NPDC051541]|uniref:STAS domain-containing protein n=1 Tax=Dactylosporangium sp. NPDC051541 TaxID=3363977 RepID=UPI0037A559F1
MAHRFGVQVGPVADGCLRIAVTGEVDLATSEVLFVVAADALAGTDAARAGTVEIDVSGVTLLAASGIGVLLAVQNRAREQGIPLTVRGAVGLSLAALEITGTLKQLEGEVAPDQPDRPRGTTR